MFSGRAIYVIAPLQIISPGARFQSSEFPDILKGKPTARAVADNHVIQDLNAQKLAASFQPCGELPILSRWLRLPARMVVAEQNRCSTLTHGRAEDFSGMHERRTLDADRGFGMHQVAMLLI
jgi:hypothetical protein